MKQRDRKPNLEQFMRANSTACKSASTSASCLRTGVRQVGESLLPPLLSWIDALARQAARDYLREEAARQADPGAERTERAPLRDMDKAA